MAVSSSFFDISSEQATGAFARIAKEHDVTCEVHLMKEFMRFGVNMSFLLVDIQTAESLIDFDVRVMSFIDVVLKALRHPARHLEVHLVNEFRAPVAATVDAVFASTIFASGQMYRQRAIFSIFVADNSM